MTITVARRYRFVASHSLAAVGPPWNEPHSHVYTVEVQAAAEANHLADGLVVDTEELDSVWQRLRPYVEVGEDDLNALYADTSVEGLAAEWLQGFRDRVPRVVAVTVWEDDERWGRAAV